MLDPLVLLGCGVPLAPVELLASLVRRDRGVMLDGMFFFEVVYIWRLFA